MLPITAKTFLKVNSCDLGIEVEHDRVAVPDALGHLLESMGARTADTFASALQDFPSAFLVGLNMPFQDFSRAREGALLKLKNATPFALPQIRPPTPGFGARPSPLRPTRTSKV